MSKNTKVEKQVLTNSIIRKIATSKKSGTLNLRGEGLTSLPHEAYHRDNLMAEESWFNVVELVQMVLSHNEIESLPNDWDVVPELKVVDFSHNQLTNLPTSLLLLQELKSMDISYNNFDTLPEEIGNCMTLVTLMCGGNRLTAFPRTFGSGLPALTKLDVSNNAISTLPDAFQFLDNLTVLNLEKNALSQIPGEVVRGITTLEELNLSHNQLTHIPPEIQYLKNLKILTMRYNQVTEIPNEVSGCSNLMEMYLGYNKLKTLPDAFGQLQKLSVLDLNSNELQAIPTNPCKTLRLTTFDLSNNNLSGLPGELGLMTTLRRLVLEGNPMRTIRRELIMGPVSRLLDSLRKKLPIEEDEQELGSFGGRVMITGDPLTQIKNQCRSYVLNNSPGELDLSNMGLKQLMEEVWDCIDYISNLNLNNNQLSEFNAGRLNQANQLRSLSMQNAQVQAWPLPSEPNSLLVLQVLDLSRNRNLSIPNRPFISCLASLQEVNLNGVASASAMMEEAFEGLTSLKVISLSMTNYQQFPSALLNLPTLCSIDLSQNGIQTLPEDITKLINLEFLDVSNNSITNLPVRIGFMHPVLKTFKVEGNILKTLRRSVLDKGTGPLLEYLRERAPPME